MKEANKKIGGVGTVKARKMLEQVEKLNVYGIDGHVYGLESKVGRHLNVMYNLGNDLMFWLIALLGTPFIYNFYDALNPVMRYAHFINDPAWRPYGWVPVVQCIIILGLQQGTARDRIRLRIQGYGAVSTDCSRHPGRNAGPELPRPACHYGRNLLARMAGGEDYPDCNILRHNVGVCAHKVALEIIPQTLALDILSEVRTTIQS